MAAIVELYIPEKLMGRRLRLGVYALHDCDQLMYPTPLVFLAPDPAKGILVAMVRLLCSTRVVCELHYSGR
jgi:hypothetical protein